jgi:hypothetical protein
MFRRALEPAVGLKEARWSVGSLLRCDSCGEVALEPVEYGDAIFCRGCQEQSDPFYRKDLYTDLGGGE